jgi:hypothetical protein
VIPPDQVEDFTILYAQNCAGCHGPGGSRGAAIPLADPVFLAIADDDAIRRTAANGVPGTPMPAFAQSAGGMLTEKDPELLFLSANAAFRAKVIAKSPVLKPLMDAYPVGQTALDATTDQINLVASNTVREDAGMIRFDYRFNDKNAFYIRYNIDDVYIDNPTDALGSHNVVPHVPTNVVLSLQHIFSPSLINEARIAFNNHATTMDCVVRNLSDGGACLNVESPLGIPDSFDLLLDDACARHCRVTWRKATQIGVAFG